MRTIAEVVEDIKNGTWGSDIEYQSECEKLHKLCDEILEIEKVKMERIVAMIDEALIEFNDGTDCKECVFKDTCDNGYEGCAETMVAVCKGIVRKGGVE